MPPRSKPVPPALTAAGSLTGRKVWTSGAHYCKRGLATVRTDFDGPKHSGITMVILDMKGPGVEVRPLRQITGGSEFNEVFFNDVFVPHEDVVGEVNAGWTVARATLGNERVSIGGGAGGIAPATACWWTWPNDMVTGWWEHLSGWADSWPRTMRSGCSTCAAPCAASKAPVPVQKATSPNLKLAEHFQEQGAIAVSLLGPGDGPGQR